MEKCKNTQDFWLSSLLLKVYNKSCVLQPCACLCTCTCVQSHLTLVTLVLLPIWHLCPWGFSFKNTGVGCHSQLQGIFLTQGSNLHLQHWQVDFLLLCLLGSSITATCIHKIRRINVNNSNSFQIGIIFSRYWHSMVKICIHELIHFHKAVLSNCTENYKHFH